MDATDLKNLKKLDKMVRQGKTLTENEQVALAVLEDLFNAQSAPTPEPKGLYDLPIARVFFVADARQMGW